MGVFIEPAALPGSGDGFCQLIFLLLVYGYVLCVAACVVVPVPKKLVMFKSSPCLIPPTHIHTGTSSRTPAR